MHPNEFKKLRTPEAAAFLGLSGSTLSKWRVFGGGPEFEKLGARIVVYDIEVLREFAARNRRSSTSDRGDAA
jgi:predicted DNA-binding transcriptional regulator AlpA